MTGNRVFLSFEIKFLALILLNLQVLLKSFVHFFVILKCVSVSLINLQFSFCKIFILVNFFTIFSLPVFALWDIFILEMITKAECS